MKRRKDKGKEVSVFFVMLIMLVHLLFLLPTVCADDQIIASFDPIFNIPDSPINIAPPHGAADLEIPVTLQVLIYDNTSAGLIHVYFYNGANDGLIGNVSVYNGSIASMAWSGLQSGRSYSWYAIANNSVYENRSDTWVFTTKSYVGGGGTPSPHNQEPIANITGPLIGYVDQTIIFSAQHSYDPDGYIAGYRWDFNNDGLFDIDWLDEVFVTHVYTTAGSYTVKLQIKDDEGAKAVDSYVIDIILLEPDQYPPIAQIEINPEEDLIINETISFDASESYDPDGVIVNYLWNFDDGNTSILLKPVHSYTQSGNYTVILSVTDDDGLTSVAAVTVSVIDNETVEPDEKPGERELPIICLIILFAAIITVIIAIIFLIKEYGLTLVMEESEKTKKDKTESIESEVDKILSKTKSSKIILILYYNNIAILTY